MRACGSYPFPGRRTIDSLGQSIFLIVTHRYLHSVGTQTGRGMGVTAGLKNWLSRGEKLVCIGMVRMAKVRAL